MSRVSTTEHQATTLGHSQSVMNIARTSPSAQIKKRRAPTLPGAPPVPTGHATFESYQVRMHTHGYVLIYSTLG